LSEDVPRYVLPREVISGVPWPPGFREEINRWALGFLGMTNPVPRGTVFMIGAGLSVMNPRDAVMLTNIGV
jgi:hypothetical protein